MQWLALFILPGILALLFLAAIYLGRSQKTPNRHSGSALEDFYRSKGMGNTLDAGYNLDGGLVPHQRKRSSAAKRQHAQHKDDQISD